MKSPEPTDVQGDEASAQGAREHGHPAGGAGAFPVAGIGASAGGLEAYTQLLSALPGTTGMAFVLVQHLDPRHESRLTQLLAKTTPMPVCEIEPDMALAPNQVFIIAPNTDVAIRDGRFHVSPREQIRGPHLPIDHFFRSLAQSHGARAIGAVLSGTGADGTLGLAEVKALGGITFAQDEQSARHTGMPHSAAESGSVDFILPPAFIAARLAEISANPFFATALEPAGGDEVQIEKVLAAVRVATRVDFSQYRETTIKRRILRRMAMRMEPSLADYAKTLAKDRSEVDALYHDLLINVTSFFRDPELFEALKQNVFPELVKAKDPTEPIRIWVPGCSTGQEAYSIAISLLEFLDHQVVRPPIQIFATDLSDLTALERARSGRYPESIEAEVGPQRLRRFFKREDHLYRIDKAIRDLCVFARQNVAADPPFSHLDLISCRNVLIYLGTPLQRRVLPMFHYALNPKGFLVLGTAETVGENIDLFEPVDRLNKIYARKPAPSRAFMKFEGDDLRATTGEQPRSANDEVLSSNENLQSTNEELETAREELQSTNEELTTVNEQMLTRNHELSQAINDLNNLLSSSNIPLVMVGGDLRIRHFTQPARRVMNLLPTDVNRPISDIKPSVIVPDLEVLIAKVIATVLPVQQEVRDHDGRWHELRIYPYRTSDHKIDGAVIELVDIDQHKRAEVSLREADRRKDEFLAILAHELRNPIAPIRNAIEIVRVAGDNPEMLAQAHDVLNRQVRQLTRIIEDLIDVSRAVEGKIEFDTRLIDASTVVEKAIETCRPYIESCNHTLEVSIPEEPLQVTADPARLSQIVINLLNNAAKFTDPGGRIWLSLERAPERAGEPTPGRPQGELQLRIRDSGVGIAPELLPRVFDMFTQSRSALEGHRSGLGVGLALVSSLVHMHGGTVEPLSAGVGHGSEFVVRLPLADAVPGERRVPAQGAPPIRRATGPRRILVVDDNIDQAFSLATLLRLRGHEIRIAHDGVSAIELAQGFQPEVGLIDIGLPGLSGYEVARKLRQEAGLESMVLAAQTGWGQPEDRKRSREAGFDFHLVKPVHPEDLERVVATERPAG